MSILLELKRLRNSSGHVPLVSDEKSSSVYASISPNSPWAVAGALRGMKWGRIGWEIVQTPWFRKTAISAGFFYLVRNNQYNSYSI